MRTAGLDLSLTASGVALSSGTLLLFGRTGITNLPVAQQFVALDELIAGILTTITTGVDYPNAVVLEALDMAQSYGGQIERTILWWEVAKTLYHLEIPVYTPTSAQVKMYATGNGLATKQQVKEAVAEHWPHYLHRNNDNLADAAVMAELGLALAGQPTVQLPAQHLRSLSKIRMLTDPPSRVLKAAAKKVRGKPNPVQG